ncbi:hypothetical protein ABE26_02155 [Cytobacillus firmus]|nr:hypothetical protein [Cytobacillus firmus]
MDYHVFKCDIHNNPFDCPDKIILGQRITEITIKKDLEEYNDNLMNPYSSLFHIMVPFTIGKERRKEEQKGNSLGARNPLYSQLFSLSGIVRSLFPLPIKQFLIRFLFTIKFYNSLCCIVHDRVL